MLKPSLISVDEAVKLVLRSVKARSVIAMNLSAACGYVLAEEIRSPIQSPPFHQSAMDGYAFRFSDYINGKTIRVEGEAAAGVNFRGKVNIGQAVRIFTGAEVPAGADTVVMQEKVTVDRGMLMIHDPLLRKSANIRRAGSQVRKGNKALAKNTLLTPAAIGFLASLGLTKVKVYRKPSVSIITTGSELVVPGKKLTAGKVYESNAVTLQTLLNREGISKITLFKVKDDPAATIKTFRRALTTSDIVLFTGGISVGDHDYVGATVVKEKVRPIFYKVKQKPGKPVYFGLKGDKIIFGLPGNPASVTTCFYEYVVPALRGCQHHPEKTLRTITLPVSHPVRKKPGLTLFLKAHTDLKTVTALEGQESYIMKSFADANCFIMLNEESAGAVADEPVRVQLFT